MSYGAELADPVADVRDIVETFRRYGVLTEDWREVLNGAADAFDQLPEDVQVASHLPVLIPRLRQLLRSGLQSDDPVLHEVAQQIENLILQIRIPGIPRPEDDHWEFD